MVLIQKDNTWTKASNEIQRLNKLTKSGNKITIRLVISGYVWGFRLGLAAYLLFSPLVLFSNRRMGRTEKEKYSKNNEKSIEMKKKNKVNRKNKNPRAQTTMIQSSHLSSTNTSLLHRHNLHNFISSIHFNFSRNQCFCLYDWWSKSTYKTTRFRRKHMRSKWK